MRFWKNNLRHVIQSSISNHLIGHPELDLAKNHISVIHPIRSLDFVTKVDQKF